MPTDVTRKNTAQTTGAGREAALFRRVAAGDREAFAEFYQVYYGRLHRFLLRLLRDVDAVQETINDVMLVVWDKADRFRGDSKISTWVFGIAYRKALKALRSERKRRGWVPLSGDELDNAPGPERRVRIHDRLQWLDAALVELNPEQRLVIELAFGMDYSYEQIAAVAKCPVNTVKTRVFHARRKLRALLPDDY